MIYLFASVGSPPINEAQNITPLIEPKIDVNINSSYSSKNLKNQKVARAHFLGLMKNCISLQLITSLSLSILLLYSAFVVGFYFIFNGFILTDIALKLTNIKIEKFGTARSISKMFHIVVLVSLLIWFHYKIAKPKLKDKVYFYFKQEMRNFVDRIVFDYGCTLTIRELSQMSNVFLYKFIDFFYDTFVQFGIILFLSISMLQFVDIPFQEDLKFVKIFSQEDNMKNGGLSDDEAKKYKDSLSSTSFKQALLIILFDALFIALKVGILQRPYKKQQHPFYENFELSVSNLETFLLSDLMTETARKLKKKQDVGFMSIIKSIDVYSVFLHVLISLGLFLFGVLIFRSSDEKSTSQSQTTNNVLSIVFNPFNLFASMILFQNVFTIYFHFQNLFDFLILFDKIYLVPNKKFQTDIGSIKSIVIKNAGAGYNDLEIVSFNNIYISSDFYKIIGKSGEGKTTMIKLILGLIKPTRGKVEIVDDQGRTFDVNNISRSILLDQVVYSEQDATDSLDNTILQLFRSFKPNITPSQILFLLNFVDLQKWYGKQPSGLNSKIGDTLSGGMKKRLNLACSLTNIIDKNNHLKGIVIIDEGLDSLDPETRAKIINRLYKFVESKELIIIIITHSDDLLNQVRHIIAKVDNGLGEIFKFINRSGEFNIAAGGSK